MKLGKMKANEALLDFGTIKRDEEFLEKISAKTIMLTVFSNYEWILLAKPNSSDSIFSSLFTNETSPLMYSVRTNGVKANDFYPFIKDEYIIIASGKKTTSEGQIIEIEFRLNSIDNLNTGTHSSSIDFVLLTKDRYKQKVKRENDYFFLKDKVVSS